MHECANYFVEIEFVQYLDHDMTHASHWNYWLPNFELLCLEAICVLNFFLVSFLWKRNSWWPLADVSGYIIFQVRCYTIILVVGARAKMLRLPWCHGLAFSRVGTCGACFSSRAFTYLAPENKPIDRLIYYPILRNRWGKHIN